MTAIGSKREARPTRDGEWMMAATIATSAIMARRMNQESGRANPNQDSPRFGEWHRLSGRLPGAPTHTFSSFLC
jgi:hypothetical protein